MGGPQDLLSLRHPTSPINLGEGGVASTKVGGPLLNHGRQVGQFSLHPSHLGILLKVFTFFSAKLSARSWDFLAMLAVLTKELAETPSVPPVRMEAPFLTASGPMFSVSTQSFRSKSFFTSSVSSTGLLPRNAGVEDKACGVLLCCLTSR